MQLTIDYDVQKAAEDGVPGATATTARRSCSIREPARCSRSRACRRTTRTRSRPASTARRGRAQHRRAAAAAEPRDPGPLLARIDLQDGGGGGGARGRDHHARLPGALRRAARPSTAASSSAGTKGGHGTVDLRHAIEQSCNVYFYTLGNMVGVDRSTSGRRCSASARRAASTCRTRSRASCRRTEWKQARTGEKWYAGETISVAIGQGQVSVTPISMAVYMATLANGGTRVTPHLLQGRGRRARAGSRCRRRAPQSRVTFKPETRRGDPRRAVDGRQRRGHRRPRADRGPRRVGQDRHGAGDLEPGAKAARGQAPTRTCATTAGSCSSRRATIRRSPAWCSPSTASTATHAAPIAQARPRDVLREEGRHAAAGVPPAVPPPAGAATHGTEDRRSGAAPRQVAVGLTRPRPTPSATRDMFERRLYFHIDWALIVAVLALCAASAWR